MRVSSHQPSLFPWAGYWHKLLSSDLHIVSAGVKFDYAGYQNRVPFNGGWLTVPVCSDSKNQLIKDVRFHPGCLDKVYRTIAQTVGAKRQPHRDRVLFVLEMLLTRLHTDFLLDLNMVALDAIRHQLNCAVPVAVDLLPADETLNKTDRLVARLRRHAGTGPLTYLSGAGAAAYIDPQALPPDVSLLVQFAKEGVCADLILQSLASDHDPVSRVTAMFGWWPVASSSSLPTQTTPS